ncbi:MAG: hypothetical protein QW506_02585 [Thermoproteota archaeon]
MLRKFLIFLRDVEDAAILSKFLKNIGFKGKIMLAALDVAYIPVDKMIVRLNNIEWIKDCLSCFEGLEVEVRTVKYNGSIPPAEALLEVAKEGDYHLIIVTRRNIVRGVGMDLALAIAGISSIPVLVVPFEGFGVI